jgi:hypothetical protein
MMPYSLSFFKDGIGCLHHSNSGENSYFYGAHSTCVRGDACVRGQMYHRKSVGKERYVHPAIGLQGILEFRERDTG